MVRLGHGGEVMELLSGIANRPGDYTAVMVASPFIDDVMQEMLMAVGSGMCRTSGVLKVVTRLEPARCLRKRVMAGRPGNRIRLFAVERLHAKVYLVVGRWARSSRAVVTSAELDVSGMTRQIEVGTVATPTSAAGRRLMNAVLTTFGQLTEHPPRGVARCVL